MRPFDSSLQEIKKLVLDMGRMVEIAINQAVKSLQNEDEALAQKVVDNDVKVNEIEDLIDDKVVKLIATQQPVARDLRTLIAAMKLSNDLERMADLAEDIAEVTLEMKKLNLHLTTDLTDILKMAEITQQMVNDGINSYVDGNMELARSLAVTDDKVDELHNNVVRDMIKYASQEPEYREVAMRVSLVARFLERIADHTVNLGESVIFIESGKKVDLN